MPDERSVFIVGCGRSGTSMVAGLFAKSGRFMGESLHPARESNPKGFFESPQINGLNEKILLPYLPSPFMHDGIEYGADAPRKSHTWLARLGDNVNVKAGEHEKRAIAELTAKAPFCYKDTRFGYTLRNWIEQCNTPYRVVFVFRHPAVSVQSILKEIYSQPYLNNFAISVNQAFELWATINKRLLSQYNPDQWIIVSYDQVLEGNGVSRIEEFIGEKLDNDFPAFGLKRSEKHSTMPDYCRTIYDKLLAYEQNSK